MMRWSTYHASTRLLSSKTKEPFTSEYGISHRFLTTDHSYLPVIVQRVYLHSSTLAMQLELRYTREYAPQGANKSRSILFSDETFPKKKCWISALLRLYLTRWLPAMLVVNTSWLRMAGFHPQRPHGCLG
ncbi:hypothetical protein M413DRAFT_277503 [Hebeloma cylindrosporum]|uniref:Uncharacterized protein n=1 Tax=Hebeloma cylindrosporum TaxID=76867 RepID=A0A0C3BKT7_HEBCY|nr:hypothetical protein M413DRAFT_277503 [Hebeloma cylindrosporum h7]